MLHSLLAGLLDLVSPPICAGCRSPMPARELGFCDACRPLIELAPWSAEDVHRDACLYGGPIRDALHRLKYEGASELAPALADWLIEPAQDFAGRVSCVTAVPLHPHRLRARGYNQSILLARPVARMLGVALRTALVRRVRDTPAQVGKGPRERRAQLTNAFRAHAHARGQSILVVDDVRTTGATLLEVCRALEAAGARQLFTLTLAGAVEEDQAAASRL